MIQRMEKFVPETSGGTSRDSVLSAESRRVSLRLELERNGTDSDAELKKVVESIESVREINKATLSSGRVGADRERLQQLEKEIAGLEERKSDLLYFSSMQSMNDHGHESNDRLAAK
jgi:hypothetical protein